VDIVAHSFGARVALALAAEHPETVGKLVIPAVRAQEAPPSATVSAPPITSATRRF
jgi:pimeloyl-ACP methyl ester carboxylesterase